MGHSLRSCSGASIRSDIGQHCRRSLLLARSANQLARRSPLFRRVSIRPSKSAQKDQTSTATLERAKEQTAVSSENIQDREIRRQLEDELRDPKNFIEYFVPRQLRILFFTGSAVGCFMASLLSAVRLAEEPALMSATGGLQDLGVNLTGLALFSGLLYWDMTSAKQRVARRHLVRKKQIEFGDREVFVNDRGERMSRLKEVNDDWILRRLERWGRRDKMPFIGPAKGAQLQGLVREAQPRLAVEVGTMAGYSAILIAQALDASARLISMEKELSWVLVAKRFLWQSSQGKKGDKGPSIGEKVEVQWGDACQLFRKLSEADKIDFLLLDGTPKEYLEYLKAAEPHLAAGAVVVADNAGVFAQGGLQPYLEYVRSSPSYESRFVSSTLEWRDDVKDGLEVSRFIGHSAGSAP